jgi:acyl carrier protein
MSDPPPPIADPRAQAVIELLAQHAHVEPAQLQPEMRADELGLSRLEMALALFDIEDRFDVHLPQEPDAAAATVGQLVQQVLRSVDGDDAVPAEPPP